MGLDLKKQAVPAEAGSYSLPSSFHKKSLAAEMSFGAHNCDPASISGCFSLLAVSSYWQAKCVQCENAGVGGGLHVGQCPGCGLMARENCCLCWYQILVATRFILLLLACSVLQPFWI